MSTKTGELAKECRRQEESCLYMSTQLYAWLVVLRTIRFFTTLTSVVLGALGGWTLLTAIELPAVKVFVAGCAFLAGLLPAVYTALKFDESLELAARLAGEFKALEDDLRRCALVSSRKSFKEFEAEATAVFERLKQAKAPSITVPWPFFKYAQWKIKKGDYNFSVDLEMEDA